MFTSVLKRILSLCGLLGVLLVIGCGGSPNDATTPVCSTSSECTTPGQLCVAGTCTPCQQSAACEADPTYSAAQQTQCREGVCTTCTDGLVGCGCVDGSCTTGECVGGTCTDCTRGAIGCVCLANQTCQEGAVCGSDGLCAACTPGSQACSCAAGNTCDAGLTCQDGTCAPGCNPGDTGCACAAESSCASADAYCDSMNICQTCSPDVPGCPCQNDETCLGDNFCQSGTCEACPATDKPASCECTARAECGDGLVCDADSFACRDTLTCNDITCLPNQLCALTSTGAFAGDAYCVPEACVPGFVWDASAGQCVPQPTGGCYGPNGTPTGNAQACTAQSKACIDGPSGPVCADTCATLGCAAAHRACMPGLAMTDDATCGACEPGFVDTQGTCQLDFSATCTGPDSIGAQCGALNRECVDRGPGASCGACTGGRIANPRTGLCEAVEACGERQCFDHEFCFYPANGTPPVCRPRCGPGQALNSAGACVSCASLSCSGDIFGTQIDNQCACESDVFCAYNVEAGGPRCELSPCPDGQALDPASGTCASCNLTCGSRPGETGRVWWERDRSGICFCETRDDFFRPSGDTNAAQSCDADGDGWINRPAELTYAGASMRFNGRIDTAALANFRCPRRTIDRVRLVNEYGQRREVGICNGQIADWAPGQVPNDCTGGPTEVPLFEVNALDDQDAIRRDNTRMPAYGGDNGRKFYAAELNPMTKACVSTEGDFNRNDVRDLREQQVMLRSQLPDPSVTNAELLYQAVAFFLELHTSYYEAPTGPGPGVFVIEERTRCEQSFPVTYAVGRDAYWTTCHRRRNASYDGALPSADRVTMDFAQFSCEPTSGTCAMPDALITGANQDGDRVVDHDVCALRAAGQVVADEPWLGMGHHSQFACTEISTGAGTHRTRPDRLSVPDVVGGAFDLNVCRTVVCNGQPGCNESLPPSGASANTNQPAQAEIACSYQARTNTALGTVGFVSALYRSSNLNYQYERGCIDEARDTRSAVANQLGSPEVARGWSYLCPGFLANPDGVLTVGATGNFGKLICGCGIEFNGPGCETACPVRPGQLSHQSSFLHVGDIDRGLSNGQRSELDCQPGTNYCTQWPADPSSGFAGGQRGYWMCGRTTSSAKAQAGDPRLSATLTIDTSTAGAVLTGAVRTGFIRGAGPMTSSSTTACASGGPGCFETAPGVYRQLSIY